MICHRLALLTVALISSNNRHLLLPMMLTWIYAHTNSRFVTNASQNRTTTLFTTSHATFTPRRSSSTGVKPFSALLSGWPDRKSPYYAPDSWTTPCWTPRHPTQNALKEAVESPHPERTDSHPSYNSVDVGRHRCRKDTSSERWNSKHAIFNRSSYSDLS